MKCLTTVSYSVVVNGYIGESFQPTRGLRQGDPLSPFLFLICGEGLSCLMTLACREGLVKGAKASRNGPQGWRLITYPNSLVARVLKAKYYPNTDFNNAQLGNIPSLTWKSVWAAKGLLNNGLCWRVGKGDGISIWEDCWIPGKKPEEWNRRNRSEEYNVLCPRCGNGEEDSEHVFLNCPVTVEIWRKLEVSWVDRTVHNIWEWITWIFQKTAIQQRRLLCCGLWIIWSSRNKLVHERKLESADEISQNIRRYMAEIEGLEEKKLISPKGCRSNVLDVNTRATIQFGAALDNRNHRSVSGVVVWSQTGELIALKSMINVNVSSPFIVEAYTGLQAVELGISLKLPSVMVMGDSRTVIKKCQSKNSDKSVIGTIIRDIHSSMHRFQEIKFQFIKRTENAYAHNLAKESLRKNKGTYQRRPDLTQHHSQPEGRWRNNPD
ncbi:hypothetical protein PVK06_021259 [Gossypium arboreum]|uniref:RNase H type-1 domain-containing protein n=1 Tax=Gossypium arboreum TaxID=29729 RepID=A0ABR0PQ08_GOSAR|nr:hypothetical protein PVK06_021259 [Gossypium arboreum]